MTKSNSKEKKDKKIPDNHLFRESIVGETD